MKSPAAPPSVTCYAQDSKPKSRRVLEAFAAGCGGRMASTSSSHLEPGAAAFYGVRPGWAHLWKQARASGRHWYYLDNSWFDACREAYFRVGVDSVQSWSRRPSDGKRLAALGVRIQPWRTAGKRIVICAQTDEFMRCVAGWDGVAAWQKHVLHRLRPHTDRQMIVREKRSGIPLAADLADAWLLVAHSSAAAVEALIAGVPVIVTDGACAAAEFGSTFETVESPRRPEGREAWAARLADSQWRLSEMREGLAWRMLNE